MKLHTSPTGGADQRGSVGEGARSSVSDCESDAIPNHADALTRAASIKRTPLPSTLVKICKSSEDVKVDPLQEIDIHTGTNNSSHIY